MQPPQRQARRSLDSHRRPCHVVADAAAVPGPVPTAVPGVTKGEMMLQAVSGIE